MKQIIRELKRQVAGEKLEPELLKGLIRAGYVYRNGYEHLLTDRGPQRSVSARRLPERGATGHRNRRGPRAPWGVRRHRQPSEMGAAVRGREVGVPAHPAWLAERPSG